MKEQRSAAEGKANEELSAVGRLRIIELKIEGMIRLRMIIGKYLRDEKDL